MSEDPADLDPISRIHARGPGSDVAIARMTTLLELLGRPDQAAPVIHVAGSHGRGSIARGIGCLVAGLGLSVGSLATSHLQDVRERIRVAGASITPEDLEVRLDELEPYLSEVDLRHHEPVGFAEALTALAFAHFADVPVDVVVLEGEIDLSQDPGGLAIADVGVLSGPVGSAKATWPQLNTAHAEALAERVSPGGTIVASGLGEKVATALEAAASQRDIRTVSIDESSGLAARRLAVGGQHLDLLGASAPFDDVYLPVHGAHQARNAMCALAAIEAFVGVAGGLDPDIVRESFAALRLPGRLEVIRRRDASSVILDAADDPASASAMSAALRDEFEVRHRLLIIGLGDPREVPQTVRLETTAALVETAHHVVLVRDDSHAQDSHEQDLIELQRVAASSGATVEIADDVTEGIGLASGVATAEDILVVAGSTAVVGEARSALGLGAHDGAPEPPDG